MSILRLRKHGTAVYDNAGVQMTLTQQSRHRWQGVLKFSARSGAWLPNGGTERLNFRDCRISNLSVTGVRLIAKLPPGTRGSGVRASSVGCLRNSVGKPLRWNPCTEWAVIRPACTSAAGEQFSFYVRLLSDGRFRRDGRERVSADYGRPSVHRSSTHGKISDCVVA